MTIEDKPIAFFRLGPAEPTTVFRLPETLTSVLWRPTWRVVRPPGLTGARWLIWWAMHHFRVFGNADYGVLLVVDGTGCVVHRAGIFPRWARYPFMEAKDLQIGDVWTEPAWRGKGIATSSISTIVSSFTSPDRQFWYLTEPDNHASIRAVEKNGFEQHGEGRRIPRLRLHVLGQFVVH